MTIWRKRRVATLLHNGTTHYDTPGGESACETAAETWGASPVSRIAALLQEHQPSAFAARRRDEAVRLSAEVIERDMALVTARLKAEVPARNARVKATFG